MSSDLQTIDWAGATPFAKSAKFVGESPDQSQTAELYYLTYIDQTAGDPGQLVIIWVDNGGVVQGIGISYRVI